MEKILCHRDNKLDICEVWDSINHINEDGDVASVCIYKKLKVVKFLFESNHRISEYMKRLISKFESNTLTTISQKNQLKNCICTDKYLIIKDDLVYSVYSKIRQSYQKLIVITSIDNGLRFDFKRYFCDNYDDKKSWKKLSTQGTMLKMHNTLSRLSSEYEEISDKVDIKIERVFNFYDREIVNLSDITNEMEKEHNYYYDKHKSDFYYTLVVEVKETNYEILDKVLEPLFYLYGEDTDKIL